MATDKKQEQANKQTAKDYERMGRELESLYQNVSPNRRVFYRTALLKGVLAGMGGVLGATVGIALLIWVLSWFDSIPLLGPFIDSVLSTIESH